VADCGRRRGDDAVDRSRPKRPIAKGLDVRSRGRTDADRDQRLDASAEREEVDLGVTADELDLVGIALRAERKTVDKVLDRLRPHP